MAKLEDRSRSTKDRQENLEQQKSRKVIAPAEKPALNKPSRHNDAPLEAVRNWVGQNFLMFLKKQKKKELELEANLLSLIEEAYDNWAEMYELVHKNFSELWDVLNLIEQDTKGWFRVAPKGNKSFVSINESGYSFAAGIEKNYAKGAPMPSKFILITFAHSDHRADGIGDERRLGRPEPIDDRLAGFKSLKIIDQRKAFEVCSEMLQRAESSEIIIQIYSEYLGARGVKVPLSTFKTNSLAQLIKGLFVALNQDQIKDLSTFFQPGTKIELLEHSRIK